MMNDEKTKVVIIQLVFGVVLMIGGMFFIDPTRFLQVNSDLRVVILGLGLAILYFKDGLMLLANSVITLVVEYWKG